MEAGIDSLAASELVQRLSCEFSVELPATLLFDHPSVSSISQYIALDVNSIVESFMSLPIETMPIPTAQSLLIPGADSGPLIMVETGAGGRIVTLSFNRPMIFNGAPGIEVLMASEMGVVADDRVACVCIVTGHGHVYHVAEHRNNREFDPVTRRHAATRHYLQHYFDTFIDYPKSIIAALNGSAYGGAATSTSHCDNVIAVERAQLSFPFKRWFLVAEGGSTVHLARLSG